MMQLRYVVPGVLALVGCWWWYTSRKKAQITSQDNEETQAMESSCQDRPNADEERPSDQEVTVQVHAPATKTSAGEPVGSPDTVMASGQLGSPSCSSATTGSQQNSPETIMQNPPVPSSTPSAEHPESEAEVAGDILPVAFPENVQEDLVKDSLCFTRDDFTTTTAVDQCAQSVFGQSVAPESPMVSASFPLSASTPISDACVEPLLHENCQPAETSINMEDLQHLVAGLITEVILVAQQEVMAESSCETSEAEKCSHNRPETAALSTESSHLPTGDKLDSATQPQDQTIDKQEPDTKKIAPTVSSDVELSKAEHPESEVEVAIDILAVPFAENAQVDLVKDSLSFTRDDLSSTTTTAVDQFDQSVFGYSVGPESPMVSASLPLSASTPISDTCVETLQHENGDFSQPAETSDNMVEILHMATDVITELILVAQQEVRVVISCKTSEAASSSTPTFNDKETTKAEDLHASYVGSSSPSNTDDIQEEAAQIVKEVINGCLSPFVNEKAQDKEESLVSSQGELELALVLPKLQADEAITATKDFGCGTCQSEVGIGSEHLLFSTAVPENEEDLIEISGFLAVEPVCSPVTVVVSGKPGTPSCSSAATDQEGSPEMNRQNPPVSTSTPSTVIEKCSHNRPEAAAVSTESSHLPTGDKLDSATQPQDQTVDKQEPDTKKIAPTVSSDVELSKAELPESEVEVAVDISAVPFADNVQEDLMKDSLSFTRDDLSSTTTTAVDQCAQSVFGYSVGPESPMGSSFLPSASTHVSDASVEPQHHENGDISWPADTSKNMEELQHFVAGLITEVITVGQQEVMDVSSCRTSEAASSSTPTLNDKETTRDKDLHASHVGSSSPSNTDDIQEHPAQIMKEVINGFLTPFVGEKAKDKQECLVSSKGQLESALVLPKLQAEEAISATKDSECSTCQSEDGMSSKDLLSSTGLVSAMPENEENPIQISGFLAIEPVCSPVTVTMSGKLDTPSCSSEATDQEGSPELNRQNPPVPISTPSNVVEECSHHKRPEDAARSTESSNLPTGDDLDSATQPEGQMSDTVLPKLPAEEAITATKDSTCQLEDGISSKDLLSSTGLSSAVPECTEDLLERLGYSISSDKKEDGLQESSDVSVEEKPALTREHVAAASEAQLLNRTGLNGTIEEEAEQSRGSDVNSMGSVGTLETGSGQQSSSQASLSQSSEPIKWEVEVPKHLVSRLIGQQGKYVIFLKQRSGAEIYIITLPHTKEFEICHIEGTQQQVDKALALIGKKFRNLDLTNKYAPPPLPSQLMMNWQSGSQASLSQSSELIQLDFEVPKHLVSRLIGKQGKYVNFLKQSSGAEVYVTTLPYTKEFEICRVKGTQQQVDKAMALIGKKFRNLDLTSLHAHVGPGEQRGGSQQTPCAVLRHDPKSHSLYC